MTDTGSTRATRRYTNAMAGAALVVGVVLGAVGAWLGLSPRVPVDRVVTRELSDGEREGIWRPRVAEAAGRLDSARVRITALEQMVTERDREISVLEAALAATPAPDVETLGRLAAARAARTAAEADLVDARFENTQLLAELLNRTDALADQATRLDDAESRRHEALWTAFLAQSRLDLCDRGGAQKTGRCRDDVLGSLDERVHQVFLRCLRSGQEPPSLREAERGQEQLPQFASWLGPDDRATRDWFLLGCDPTLPEAPGASNNQPSAGG